MRWLWILAVCTLAACQSPSSKDDTGPIPGTFTYNFNVTSAANMPSGTTNVVFISSPATDVYCSTLINIQQDQLVAVTSPGTVTFNFSVLRSTFFWYSVYIDADASTKLTTNDWVWGANNMGLFGFCVTPRGNQSVTNNINWENVGTTYAGGYVQYQGTPSTTF